MTQEALIEVLRNQHQNIVQQQNLIAGQGAQISELTKLVSGLVQMQTDVLKDQAQREADERERKAAEEAATSGYKRGLDFAVLQEREQGGLTCGYELFRRINNLLELRLERKHCHCGKQ